MKEQKKNRANTGAERLAKANRVAMICHLLCSSALSLAYLAEVIKGEKTLVYWLILLLLGMGPVVLELVLYKIKPTHAAIKHLVPFGYAALYIMILFTTDNPMAFVYVVPMMIAITIYSDTKYSVEIGCAEVIVNIIYAVVRYGEDGFSAVEIANTEIQIAVLVLMTIISYYTSRVSYKMSQIQIESVKTEKERSEELLEKILEVSSGMQKRITEVAQDAVDLGESIDGTQTAMDELTGGANDTAEAVQRQLIQTAAIAQKVIQVKEASEQIAGNMEETQSALTTGNLHIERLVEQVSLTEQTNEEVAAELGQLKDYMEQMYSVMELINNITSQTSLLSLNASIEAARAGEAGRGFAVVASEISGLASQTQDATVKIQDLIGNVSSEIGKVVAITESMIEQVKKQNEAVGETAESFAKISQNAQNIGAHSDVLTSAVGELEEANGVISDNIQTISAISQEVAAHTNTTYTACVENKKTITRLMEQAEDLEKLAEKLNA